MAATPVTVVAAQTTIVPIAGVSVLVVLGGPLGGVIENPVAAADQGLAEAEPLYVNPLGPATLFGNGTTIRLDPGESWEMVPGQTNGTWVNAPSAGHEFSAYVLGGPAPGPEGSGPFVFVPTALTGF